MPRDLMELKDELNHKIRSAEDIKTRAEKEDRLITEAEDKLINDTLAEGRQLSEQIQAIEHNHAIGEKIDAEVKALQTAGQRKAAPTSVTEETPAPRISMPSYTARYGALKAFKGKNAEVNAYKSGQWLRASLLGDNYARNWCRQNGVQVSNALSEGTNTAGGNLVPDEFSQSIIDLREVYGVFRRECELFPMARDLVVIPRRAGGVTASFVAENSALSESDPSWDNITLTAHKLGVLTRMSTEVAEDAVINMADNLAREFAYALALKEDQCGFIGDGTATYGGIQGVQWVHDNNNASTGTAYASSVDIATQSHDLFSEVDATDLAVLMGKLPQYAQAGAKWYCSQPCKSIVFDRLASAAGGNTMTDIGGMPRPSYLGHEIVVSQVLRSITTAIHNLTILLFGRLDLACVMGERRGVTVMQSGERYFDTDQIGVRATSRLDINYHGRGDTSTAGPIVALIGSTS